VVVLRYERITEELLEYQGTPRILRAIIEQFLISRSIDKLSLAECVKREEGYSI
jgi:hypothetical protein